ncbi:MAG: glycosyltransferase [Roseburia sp.]|nr:glycosyltransferase [Roseburia sp.]
MDGMDEDLISVIVPVYNVEKYIIETIECVRAQSYPRWELLLVEDRSTDNTLSVLQEYLELAGEERLRLIRQPSNQGAARARNRGVSEAAGRYIAYLDADDLWASDKLEKELAFMRQKKAAFVFTGYEFANEQGKGLGRVVRVPEKLSYKEALKNTTIFTSTVLLDTSCIKKELLMMPEIKSEDTALWWQLLRNGYTAYGLDENLVKYRRPGKSLSSNKLEAIRRIWNLYRRAEGMGILASAWSFCFWAARAVLRRISVKS